MSDTSIDITQALDNHWHCETCNTLVPSGHICITERNTAQAVQHTSDPTCPQCGGTDFFLRATGTMIYSCTPNSQHGVHLSASYFYTNRESELFGPFCSDCATATNLTWEID